ncbi:hypothetical protein CLV36_104197 [Laceyella sediminis]|uniref:Uncharacterized protein n=1 Tax=Laceyella sediminis TaxID=573074 RepID=A0ABX5EQC3_9BACL|nr:hypothetical protein CLV36_104197 [Laceyella sediminis]
MVDLVHIFFLFTLFQKKYGTYTTIQEFFLPFMEQYLVNPAHLNLNYLNYKLISKRKSIRKRHITPYLSTFIQPFFLFIFTHPKPVREEVTWVKSVIYT